MCCSLMREVTNTEVFPMILNRKEHHRMEIQKMSNRTELNKISMIQTGWKIKTITEFWKITGRIKKSTILLA